MISAMDGPWNINRTSNASSALTNDCSHHFVKLRGPHKGYPEIGKRSILNSSAWTSQHLIDSGALRNIHYVVESGSRLLHYVAGLHCCLKYQVSQRTALIHVTPRQELTTLDRGGKVYGLEFADRTAPVYPKRIPSKMPPFKDEHILVRQSHEREISSPLKDSADP